MSDPKMEEIHTTEYICNFLGVDEATLTYLRTQRDLPYVQLKGSIKAYYEKDVLAWLMKNRKNTADLDQ